MATNQEELLRSPAVWQPRSVEEAIGMKEALGPAAVYAAGSTLLRTQWEAGTAPMPSHLIDLGSIASLYGIKADEREIVIGPMMTLTECRTSGLLSEYAPLLVEAVRNIAGWSVRNLATLGGNVVYRVGDAVPALIALNAQLEWRAGSRLCVESAEEWASSSSSAPRLLTSIRIPCEEQNPTSNTKRFFAFHKVGRREAFTPSLVTVAIQGSAAEDGALTELRIAAGGGQTKPARMTRAEELLLGAKPDGAKLRQAFEAVLEQYEPKTDPFATDPYRKRTAANLVVAALWSHSPTNASKG